MTAVDPPTNVRVVLTELVPHKTSAGFVNVAVVLTLHIRWREMSDVQVDRNRIALHASHY